MPECMCTIPHSEFFKNDPDHPSCKCYFICRDQSLFYHDCAKVHMPVFTSLLLSTIWSKFEENFHVDSLLFDIPQKYWHSNTGQHGTLHTLHLDEISSSHIGKDVCMHTAYTIWMVASLHWKWPTFTWCQYHNIVNLCMSTLCILEI